jgi:hypothetical protein
MEGPVKSKEDLDNLADRFDKDVTYTVSPRAAKKCRYGVESSDKSRKLESHHVAQSFAGIGTKDHG